MVCADDTLSNLDGWVDVAADVCREEETTMPPLLNVKAPKMNDDTESLALRHQRQHEAQLAFIRKEGLLKEEKDKDKDVDDVYAQAKNAARKAGVAAAGGTLVAVGAILTPLPTPGGILLAGAGLGVLSTEFESAKKLLDNGKEKLVDLIDSIPEEQLQEEDMDDGELIDMKTSEDSEDTASIASVMTERSVDSSKTNQNKGQVRDAFHGQARRIGKTIRPFLTDEDAPRQAMEDLNATTKQAIEDLNATTKVAMGELNASTKRAYSMASGSIINAVKFVLVLDEYDPSHIMMTPPPSPIGPSDDALEATNSSADAPTESKEPSDAGSEAQEEPSSQVTTTDQQETTTTDEVDSTAEKTVAREENAPMPDERLAQKALMTANGQ